MRECLTIMPELDKESGRVLGKHCGITDLRVVIVGVGDLVEPLVRILLLCGARVAISRNNPDLLAQNLEYFGSLAWSPEHLVGITCDSRSDLSVAAVVDHATGAFGGLDAAVYAVGAVMKGANVGHGESLLQVDLAAVKDQFDADALGAVRFAQALQPHLRSSAAERGKPARFILTGSIGPGANGSATQTASFGYNCAKVATHIMSEMLTRSSEWGLFCRVNVVAPGPVITKLNRARMSADQLRGQTALLNTPTGELCTLDDPAGTYFHLLSTAGKGIHGQILVVDNGLTRLAPY